MSYRKFMAVSCSHGQFACPEATEAVLTFADRFEPHVKLDLGDTFDFTAFRTGAKGTADESAPVGLDYSAGIEWLKLYQPTHRCHGNHDHRIYKHLNHPNAIMRHCASLIAHDVATVDEANGTQVKQYKRKGNWFQFGDTRFGHGIMYNATALRDHAEHFGNIVIGHLHAPGQIRGRRSDNPMGTCVGCIMDPDKAEYADLRRNTDTWGHGIAYGFYSETETVTYLIQQQCRHGANEPWLFPL